MPINALWSARNLRDATVFIPFHVPEGGYRYIGISFLFFLSYKTIGSRIFRPVSRIHIRIYVQRDGGFMRSSRRAAAGIHSALGSKTFHFSPSTEVSPLFFSIIRSIFLYTIYIICTLFLVHPSLFSVPENKNRVATHVYKIKLQNQINSLLFRFKIVTRYIFIYVICKCILSWISMANIRYVPLYINNSCNTQQSIKQWLLKKKIFRF